MSLVDHARALAAELSDNHMAAIGGGPVAAALLAMANECERLRAEHAAAQGREREALDELCGSEAAHLDTLRALGEVREMAAFHRAEMGEAMLIIEQQDRNLARLDAIGRRVVKAWRKSRAVARLRNDAVVVLQNIIDEDASTLHDALTAAGAPEAQPDGRYISARAAQAIKRLLVERDEAEAERETLRQMYEERRQRASELSRELAQAQVLAQAWYRQAKEGERE